MERSWREVFSPEERAIYDAYRAPISDALDLRGAALVIVDTTVEFLGRDVPTRQAVLDLPTACGSVAWRAVEQTARLLVRFRQAGRPVIYAVPDWDAQQVMGPATRGPNRVPVEGAGVIPPTIRPREGELVLKRSRPSAFFGTALTAALIRLRVDSVVLAGGTTSGCIRASAVDAASLGFGVWLVHDACFDRSALSHAVALFELERRHAVISSTDEVVA